MKRILRFKPLAAILLVLSVLMVSLCVPLPVRAQDSYTASISFMQDDGVSGNYDFMINYEVSSNYQLFLYRMGNDDNTYYQYYWGLIRNGQAIQLTQSNMDTYGLVFNLFSRLVYKGSSLIRTDSGVDSSYCSQYFFRFFIYSLDHISSCNVYIFDSLSSAVSFYESGDKSGVLRSRDSSSEGDQDPDDPSGSSWSDQVISIVNGWLGGVLETLVPPLKAIVQGILDVVNKIESIRVWIIDHLPSFISTPIKAMEDTLHGVGADILTNALEMGSTLKDIFLKLETFVANQADNLLPDFLKQAILDGLSNGLSFISGTLENFYNFHVNGLNKVINYLKSLAAIANSDDPFWVKIATLFTKPAQDMFELLFVPDEDYFDNLHTRISNRFSVITDLEEGGEHILNYFKTASGASPPSFTITLSDHGNFKLGNKTVTIDMSWYAPYKSTGDLLIAGAIWARFLWNIYRRLPEILHGAGMIADSVDKLK